MTTDNYYMKRVLDLARATKGQALPNPAVAAIIVKDNLVVGTGIHLAPDLDHAEVIAINQAGAMVFFHNIKFKQPFVTLKVGMSLDGKIATKNNLSKWITVADSRKDAHYLRATHHAILVGVNTVIADDPQLRPYLADEQDRPHINPIRIVLDHQLRTPINSKVV